MDEKKLNILISNARGYYNKKKYKKALSIIENISESNKMKLDADGQTNFTLLQCLIYTKFNRYYECFHYILPLFVKIPHQPELIAKTKEIFSQEGIHRVIHVNLPKINSGKRFFIISSEKQTTYLNLVQKVKDASEKGRCLLIFFLSVTKSYAYLDYLTEELSKFFPPNSFLQFQKEEEKYQEKTEQPRLGVPLPIKRARKKKEKEINLTKDLENIQRNIKSKNYEELKERLENIIREAGRYNLHKVVIKAQDIYNKQFFPREEKKVVQKPFPTQKPDDKERMRRSPAIRELMEELGFPTFYEEPTEEEITSMLVEEGKSEMWLQKYEKDLKMNPGSKEAWFGKAFTLKIVGRLEYRS